MHRDQTNYRELHDALHEYEGSSLYREVLGPWLEANADERSWLSAFASRPGDPVPEASVEDLWRLYALSRVNEVLLLRFQRGEADESAWPGPPIGLGEYVAFTEALGLSVVEPGLFSPFHHEIVGVELSFEEQQPIALLGCSWPCLMLGDMLFSRAGARVSGGGRVICKDVAESSTLYWAYRRKNRPYRDLSQGWGSDSQWRTAFRRDYRLGEELYYNVDGKHDLGGPEDRGQDRDGLSRRERIELLTHRGFILTRKPHDDLWPYDDRLQTKV